MEIIVKKFLVLFAMCLSVCASAAYQYEIDWSGIHVNSNSSLIVKFTDNSFFKNFDTFGYSINGEFGKEFNTDSVKGKEFDLGSFTTGDNIGFFVSQNGTYYNNFGLTSKDNGHYLFETWTSDWSSYQSFDVKINGFDSTPSGQPLPGVLTSLALGGAALLAIRKLKKA